MHVPNCSQRSAIQHALLGNRNSLGRALGARKKIKLTPRRSTNERSMLEEKMAAATNNVADQLVSQSSPELETPEQSSKFEQNRFFD